jgi:hypothetical protein
MIKQKFFLLLIFSFYIMEVGFCQSSTFGFHGELKGGIVAADHFVTGKSAQAGIGLGLGKRLLVNEELGLIWVSELGYSIWPSCVDTPNCPSWWYANPLNFATGLGITIPFQHHRITPSIRFASYYGRKQVGGLIARDVQTGEIISQSETYSNELSFGPSFRIDYQNYEFSKKMGVLVQLDLMNGYTVGSFGLTYSFNKISKLDE